MKQQPPTIENPFDYTDTVATTRWVHDHEWSSNIDRWRTVFDHSNDVLNWGFKDGIKGGDVVKPELLHSLYTKGHRVRFFVSYKSMNPVCFAGEFIDDRRMLCGTVLCDTSNTTYISVDMNISKGTLQIHGKDPMNSIDVSKSCSLLKMQITW